jgi:hypothetical protein
LDFNNLIGPSVPGTTWNNAAIQSYLQGIVPDITVQGSMGVVNYDGEGHVVGPNGVAKTLNSIENNKAFLTTMPNVSSEIVFQFATTKIYKISFDYEIFPDGTTSNGLTSPPPPANTNWPDFTFKADGQQIFHTYGAVPGHTQSANNGNPYANPYAGTYGVGGYTKSANSSTELSPQFVGYTGDIFFPNGVQKLEFIDWPPRIGIGNIHLETSSVPEPASLILMSCGLAGLAIGAIRRNRLSAVKA